MGNLSVSLKIPPTKTSPFSFYDFSGGLNNRTEIRDNQARALLNMAFASDLKVEKRPGVYPALSSVIASSNDIVYIDEFKPYTGANQRVYVTSDNIKIGIHSLGIPNVKMGITFLNQYFFVDGSDIWVFDGTYARKMVDPPDGFTPAPSPATVGVWKNDDVITPKQRWYEPCQFEIDSDSFGANLIPKKPSIINGKNGRVFISGCEDDPNNVYISDVRNGFYYPVTLPLQPTPNGEKVTALYEFMDVMVVGRTESISAIYGNTNISGTGESLFTVKNIQSHSGIMSQKSIVRMHNELVFMGSDNTIYRMITPLTDVRYITTKRLSEDIELTLPPLNLTRAQCEASNMLFHDNLLYCSIGGLLMVYSYTERGFTVYNRVVPTAMYNDNGTMIMALPTSPGYIYQWRPFGQLERYRDTIGTSDYEISAYWTSKRFNFGSATYFKQFRELFAVISTYVKYDSNLKINFEIDFIDVDSLIEVKDKVAVWGRAKFGDRFLNKDIAASIPTQIGRRGRFLAFTIANDIIDQPIRLHEIAGDYILKGRRS